MAITDSKYKRIVVKVGTSTITHDGGKANLRRLESLCRVISDLENAGHECTCYAEDDEYCKTGMHRMYKLCRLCFRQCRITQLHTYDDGHNGHERWDGKGYPDQLTGDNIPICAQVVGVADCFDALTNDRVYKKAIPLDKAYEMITSGECGMFSPKVMVSFSMPYILTSYNGRHYDVLTLAHELGHSLHSWYSFSNQPYIYSDYSGFCAEIASTTNEVIMGKYLIDKSDNISDKLRIIDLEISEIMANREIIRITFLTMFYH